MLWNIDAIFAILLNPATTVADHIIENNSMKKIPATGSDKDLWLFGMVEVEEDVLFIVYRYFIGPCLATKHFRHHKYVNPVFTLVT